MRLDTATWLRHGNPADVAALYRAFDMTPALATDGVPAPPHLRHFSGAVRVTQALAGPNPRQVQVDIYGYIAAGDIYFQNPVTGALAAIAAAAGWVHLGRIVTDLVSEDGSTVHAIEGASRYSRFFAMGVALAGPGTGIWVDFGFSPVEGA